jgi:hypothetical protein
MEKKKAEIGNPVAIAGVTIIPVTEVSLHCWRYKGGISFFGLKQPTGLIVISPSEKKAFKISGEEVPLEELISGPPEAEEAA